MTACKIYQPMLCACGPGVSVVSPGHSADALHHDWNYAGPGAAGHHPCLRLPGGRAHAHVRLRGRIRPGHALRPAPQQSEDRVFRNRMSERAALHGHPEAGVPSAADGRHVYVSSAVRTLPGSGGWHLHPGLPHVQD